MPQLTSLDLGGWKCQKYGLLSDHGQSEGWVFKHLPNLRHLKAADVSSKFFQNLCTFCIKLETLKVFSSDITDSVTKWVQNLRELKMAELLEDRGVTPIGYSQLLRVNPDLTSLGKCKCFGQVLSTLYSPYSAYRRSVMPGSIPEHLNLVSVDTLGHKMSPVELKLMVQYCPHLKSVNFKYLPDDQQIKAVAKISFQEDEDGSQDERVGSGGDASGSEEEFCHLAELAELENLIEVAIHSADFFGHQVFRLLEVRGDQLTKLCLEGMDELNLKAIILIGDHCQNLMELSLIQCYFQMQPDDPLLVEKIIHERKAISSRFNSGVGVATSSNQTPFCSGYGQNKRMGTSKRIRSTSTSSGGLGGDYLPLPFTKLESLKLDLNTPTHLPVVEFIMSFTQASLRHLSLEQFYSDFGEGLVTKTLFEWNDMRNVWSLNIGKSAKLTLVAANIILENCPNLKSLGRISSWKQVTTKELELFQQEIKLRNYDIEIF